MNADFLELTGMEVEQARTVRLQRLRLRPEHDARIGRKQAIRNHWFRCGQIRAKPGLVDLLLESKNLVPDIDNHPGFIGARTYMGERG